MTFYELFFLAAALSMDAFAVSVCKGFTVKNLNLSKTFIIAFYFGLFQAIMPLIGYLLANLFSEQIQGFDHWVAFILLSGLGIKMLSEAFKKDEADSDENDGSIRLTVMIPLAVATSIDALAAGITLRLRGVENILSAILLIGIVTLIVCMIGVKIGSIFGMKYQKKAEITGGVILILLGIKILLEDLDIISL
jgi:putative Mn2+ efflux pump MntP